MRLTLACENQFGYLSTYSIAEKINFCQKLLHGMKFQGMQRFQKYSFSIDANTTFYSETRRRVVNLSIFATVFEWFLKHSGLNIFIKLISKF